MYFHQHAATRSRLQPLAATCSLRLASSGRWSKWAQDASEASAWQPLAATCSHSSGRKRPLQPTPSKWPLQTVPSECPQVAASGRPRQFAASRRKWPFRQFQAGGRKWPQVPAFSQTNFHPQSNPFECFHIFLKSVAVPSLPQTDACRESVRATLRREAATLWSTQRGISLSISQGLDLN